MRACVKFNQLADRAMRVTCVEGCDANTTRNARMLTPLEQARLMDENAALRSENLRMAQENKLLREKVGLLIRRIFGKSSETLDEQQLMLLLQGDEPAKKAEASSASPGALRLKWPKARRRSRPRLPPVVSAGRASRSTCR